MVFSTLGMAKHPLSESTLLDNCGALHIINSRKRLDPGTFTAPDNNDLVEAKTTTFPVSGRGKPNGPKGSKVDLVLERVAVVEGFHVIISTRLLTFGIWVWTACFGLVL